MAELSPFHAAQEYFARGIACPFLVDRACSIHAHRPLACREHSVTSDAGFCASFPHPSVRMAPIPFSVGEAMRRACAKLLNEAPVAILMTFAPRWKMPSGSVIRKFSEEELVRCLVQELGGIPIDPV